MDLKKTMTKMAYITELVSEIDINIAFKKDDSTMYRGFKTVSMQTISTF